MDSGWTRMLTAACLAGRGVQPQSGNSGSLLQLYPGNPVTVTGLMWMSSVSFSEVVG